jgi:hypothetical protein
MMNNLAEIRQQLNKRKTSFPVCFPSSLHNLARNKKFFSGFQDPTKKDFF